MCGIFSLLNNKDEITQEVIQESFYNGQHRGPEFSALTIVNENVILGFHRLAINGLNTKSNQPIIYNNISLICNGEVYNFKQLYKELNITSITDSDCEVIIHLYLAYGIEHTLHLLDGYFAFILLDSRHEIPKVFAARDAFGVRPLFSCSINTNTGINNTIYGFASELKSLQYRNQFSSHQVQPFKPGSYSEFVFQKDRFVPVIENKTYFMISPSLSIDYCPFSLDQIVMGLQNTLKQAVKKRYLNTERPIACLLSGGLDSSLITALICELQKEHGKPPVETYSIGFKDSDDLKYARQVATFLGTNHHEVLLSEDTIVPYIKKVVQDIESYDVTTIRASLGNYMLGEYISIRSDAKVIFNGDGSDEVMGGYLYFSKCTNSVDYDLECRRLLQDIHLFDVLRSDRCISSHGLEPRTPFLDKAFVEYYLTIPREIRFGISKKYGEKYLLRKAFSKEYYHKELLPENVLFRKKEAFSDGVSKQHTNFYEIVQSQIKGYLQEDSISEKNFYKTLFNFYYPNAFSVIPYYWMPRFIEATDPSARTLFSTKECLENKSFDDTSLDFSS